MGDDQWSNPTPCAEWTARDLVAHVVGTQGLFLGFVGQDVGEIPSVDDDPLGAWNAARAVVQANLDDPERATAEFDGFFGRTNFETAVDRFALHRSHRARLGSRPRRRPRRAHRSRRRRARAARRRVGTAKRCAARRCSALRSSRPRAPTTRRACSRSSAGSPEVRGRSGAAIASQGPARADLLHDFATGSARARGLGARSCHRRGPSP